MSSIPPRQRATLARRIAAGLPVWAAARGSNLPEDEVGELMWEGEFRELIGAWAEILDMDAEARKRRLLKLAHAVIEARLAQADHKTAFFIQREYKRNRDPAISLAKGLSQTVDREKTKADHHREVLEAQAQREREALEAEPQRQCDVLEAEAAAKLAKAQAAQAPAASEPTLGPSPLSAAISAADAASQLRGQVDPDDAAIWRKATQLRHGMFDEQILHHAVTRKADLDRRMSPPDIVRKAEPQQEVQEFLFSSVQQEPEPPPPPPVPPVLTDENEETDTAFAARAAALFQETISQAPPHLRAILATFTQEELWALAGVDPDGSGDEQAQPQGP